MISKINQFITQNKLFTKKQKLLLAVSGGVDSVVLLEILTKLKFNITLAHCNFNLRAAESDKDEIFVRELANKYQVPLFVKQFNTKCIKGSTQMVARELRYTWFNELLQEKRLKYIVTAHHLNDSIETLLLNLTKGTGVSGLRGILPKSNNVVRPLLEITKTEILDYAKENNIQFREDSSNASNKYQRNKIRNQIIPLLKEINPSFEQSVLQTLTNLKEAEEILGNTISKKWASVSNQKKGSIIEVSIAKLKKLTPINTYVYEFFKPFGFDNNQTEQIISLCDSQSGKKIQSDKFTIYKTTEFLLVEPILTTKNEVFRIDIDTKSINNLEFVKMSGIEVSKKQTIATLDFDKLTFPLTLRKWSIGDKFAPIGMEGKEKKLSDFFTDLKLSAIDKKKVWILESNNQICWVVGLRVSENYKIGKNTKNTYLVKLLA